MNPIKRIELINFQSHVKTIIEPAPSGQLTVITGPSDSGKTSTIRALKWLLFNQPAGAEFTRTGATMVRVTVDFADGVTVIRERTKATNRYKIVRPGATEPEVFEGFGGGVPFEVQEVTGVRTVRIADLELMLNLSEQLDGPFLGSKSISSPGRAKILGKLAGTEEIDVASTETGRDLHRRNQDEKRLETEIEGLEGQIDEYEWLEGLGEKIAALEGIVERVKAATARREKLENLKAKLHDITWRETAARDTLERWTRVLPALELAVNKTEATVLRHKAVITLGEKLAWNNHERQTTEFKLQKLVGLEAAEAAANSAAENLTRARTLHGAQTRLAQVDSNIRQCKLDLLKPRVQHAEKLQSIVTNIETAAQRLTAANRAKTRLYQIREGRERAERTLQQCEDNLPDLEQAYLEALKQAGVCPVCGNTEFDINCLKEVV